MALLSIIVPTYNEAENIGRLVGRIADAFAGLDHELVFIDDSTDGTDKILADLARRAPRIRVVHRAVRSGLASAVIDGVAVAQGDLLCVLDADLQHPPEILPRLFRAMQDTEADLAIGSRYIPGGRSDFTIVRRVISRGAIALAQILLRRARSVSDPVSGLFAFRRRVVEGIALRPLGYKILLEILVRGKLSKVVEVPYHFEARLAGHSKLTMSQNWTYLRHVLRLWKGQPFSPPLARVTFPDTPPLREA